MRTATLLSAAGIAAILAGLLRAIAALVPTETPGLVLPLLYMVTDWFFLLGVIGMYLHQYERIGGLGFGAFLASVTGIVVIRSSHALPGVDLYPAGALIFALGIVVLGVALRRIGELKTWVVGLWAASLLVGVAASLVAQPRLLLIAAGLLFAVGFCGVGLTLTAAAKMMSGRESK